MAKVTISVKMQIGRSSKGCAGFGVCSVTISADVNESLSYDQSVNTMDITLSKTTIEKEQPDKLQYFEGKDSVTFEESYTFPDDIQRALKADHPLTIPPGTDQLVTSGDSYIIQNIRLAS